MAVLATVAMLEVEEQEVIGKRHQQVVEQELMLVEATTTKVVVVVAEMVPQEAMPHSNPLIINTVVMVVQAWQLQINFNQALNTTAVAEAVESLELNLFQVQALMAVVMEDQTTATVTTQLPILDQAAADHLELIQPQVAVKVDQAL